MVYKFKEYWYFYIYEVDYKFVLCGPYLTEEEANKTYHACHGKVHVIKDMD